MGAKHNDATRVGSGRLAGGADMALTPLLIPRLVVRLVYFSAIALMEYLNKRIENK
jgi:hypothetical protein